jgi:two-component system osmolarity sensor histidine kinase EnvZ
MSRLISANAFMLFLAIFVALIGAWQIQRPLLRLARAAREFRSEHRAPTVKAEGPTELRSLIGDFNEMAQELSDAEQERSIMLAGVAHDLRAPLARVQVRASLVADESIRAGFLKDAASLAQIVTQFLDLARDAELDATERWVSVDAYCRSHYAEAGNDLRPHEGAAESQATGDNQRMPLFILELKAGEGFMLPPIELDRILSNLIENGLTYGAPPLEMTTSVQGGYYVLSVRDHGAGMPEEDFARALRPFVRLDPARTGDAHCGLGLTIVRRLTRRYGGDVTISNAIGGGLVVSLSFPNERQAKKAAAGLGRS